MVFSLAVDFVCVWLSNVLISSDALSIVFSFTEWILRLLHFIATSRTLAPGVTFSVRSSVLTAFVISS